MVINRGSEAAERTQTPEYHATIQSKAGKADLWRLLNLTIVSIPCTDISA